eukprot:2046140-Rhodomonas_salina.2
MVNNKRAKKSNNWQQVLLETDLGDVDDQDDILQAFCEEELHLDFAHSITLWYNNERYYLLFIVGG